MNGRTAAPGLVVALAGILLLSGLASAAVPSGGAVRSAEAGGRTVPASPPLPSALAAPWAARSGYVSGWATNVSGIAPLSASITVTVTLWPNQTGLFDRSPLAPALSPAAFEAQYSPSPASVASLESYFGSEGLTIVQVSTDRLSMTLQGPASEVGSAFGTTIEQGWYGGDAVHFPTSVPRLPAELSGLVSAVSGLSNGFTHFTLPVARLPYAPAAGPRPAQGRTSTLITPASIHTIYDVNSLYNYSGAPHYAIGQGIALVLWGDGFSPTDTSTFFSQYYPSSFPAPQIIGVPVDGAPRPGPGAVNDPSQAPLELTLDLEWSGSQAPGASLYAVYAPDGPANDQYSPSDASLEDALSTAVGEPQVHVVSMSFATADGADPSFQAAFSTTFASATAQGITIVAASGDNGGTSNAKGACTTTPQPQFPAASPYVLAVGGTAPVLAVSLTGNVVGLESESAWSGSGGGYSVDYPAPSWQLQSGAGPVIAPHGNRGIPDVSGPASYNFLYFNGQSGAGNGTSFAAPTWAGIIAEMDALRGTPFGELNARLYAIGTAEPTGHVAPGLADITTGQNCLGPATVGWDTATGWGSPRGGALYNDLTGSYVAVVIDPSTSTATPGSSFTAQVTVLNATDRAPISGLTVNVSLSSDNGYSGPCGGTLSSGSEVSNATGVTVVSLSVPNCFLGTHATLTASVLERGLFGSNSTSISVNLLGIAGFLAFITQFPYNLIAFAVIMLVATVTGWSIGSYRRRRRSAAMLAAAGAIPSAPMAAAPSGAGPPPAPPLSAPTGGTPGPRGPAAAPGAPAPGAGGREMVGCPVCNFRFVPDLGFCPRCGHYLAPPPPRPAPPRPPPPA